MIEFQPGSTDKSVDIAIVDASGDGLEGLAYNTSGLEAYYRRGHNGTPTAITLATLANAQAAHSDGGFVEIDATHMAGMYRFDLPDAVIASGVEYVTLYVGGASGMKFTPVRIYLREVVTTTDVVDAIDAAGAAVGEVTALPSHTDGFFTQVKQVQQVSFGKRVSNGTAETLTLHQFDGDAWLEAPFTKVSDVVTVGPLAVYTP